MLRKTFSSVLFLGSLGPFQLVLTLIVFSLQRSLTPLMWAGMIASIFLGILVTIFSVQEAAFLFLTQKEQMQALQDELCYLKSSLHETQMAKLEEKETLQNALNRMRQNHEDEMKHLHSSYGKVCAENFESKNKQLTLQASLEAALEELGKVRQLEYLKQELDKKLGELAKPVESVDQSYFFDHVHMMEEEAMALQQEIITLQEIITHILSEKKVSRPKKVKKEVQPTLLV